MQNPVDELGEKFMCKRKAPGRVLKDKEITNEKIKYLEKKLRRFHMS